MFTDKGDTNGTGCPGERVSGPREKLVVSSFYGCVAADRDARAQGGSHVGESLHSEGGTKVQPAVDGVGPGVFMHGPEQGAVPTSDELVDVEAPVVRGIACAPADDVLPC